MVLNNMYSIVISSLFLGASALTFPRASSSNCSFELTASGGQSGTIGSLSDGQNRIGGGLSPVTFIINNGGITNSWGNGCILTPSVEQFQCDSGVGPTYGFSISNNGSLLNPSGNSVFYACPASDTEWNLYTTPVVGQLKCVRISLTASACYGSSSGSSSRSSSASKTASSIQAIGTTSSASSAHPVGTSPSSSSPETVTVTVYNCGLASSASSSALRASTSPAVVETQTTAPQASTSQVSTSQVSAIGKSSTQTSTTAPQASSKTPSSVASVKTTTKSTTPAVGESTTTPAGILTKSTSLVKSATETSPASTPVGQTTTAITVPVKSTTPAIGKTTTPASETVTTEIIYATTTVCPVTLTHTTGGTTSLETTSSISTVWITSTSTVCTACEHVSTSSVKIPSPTTAASTSEGVTTEVVYATTTVCPVTLTYTTGGTTSLKTTSSISTVWITSTSTVCTACKHSSTSSAKISGHTSTSPAESSYIQSISSASTPRATVVPSGGYNASTTPLASRTGVTTKTTTSAAASGTSSGSSTCVSTALTGSYTNGNYQYPHLIIPVSEETPDTAAGTQYFGTISKNTSTIFNFDVPSTYSGHTCNLIFLLPLQSELETSSYTFSGAGTIDFEQLSTAATSATTYNNAPSVKADLGTFTLTEGSSTLIKQFDCSAYAGTTYTAEMKAVGDTYLYYFQDWNPSPLGIYITVC